MNFFIIVTVLLYLSAAVWEAYHGRPIQTVLWFSFAISNFMILLMGGR